MAPLAYAGALQPKKKADLQQIADSLKIESGGTKEELQARIKRHLDANQDKLEDDPVFAGLYSRRRRGSSKPPPAVNAEPSKPSRARHRALEAVQEQPAPATPAADLQHVSSLLKSPFNGRPSGPPSQAASPAPVRHVQPEEEEFEGFTLEELGYHDRRDTLSNVFHGAADALGQLSALIPRAASPTKMLEAVQPQAEEILARARRGQRMGTLIFADLQDLCSSARTIWLFSAFMELIGILVAVVPWTSVEVHLLPESKVLQQHYLRLPYAPLAAFQTRALWLILWHRAFPALILPAICGFFCSFVPPSQPTQQHMGNAYDTYNTVPSASRPGSPRLHRRAITPAGEIDHEDALVRLDRTVPPLAGRQNFFASPEPVPKTTVVVRPFDALTASIVRLVADIAYPYAKLESQIVGIDVLGPRLRVLTAGLIVALAFSEALSKRRA